MDIDEIRFYWPNGGNWSFFLNYEPTAKVIIDKYKITPVQMAGVAKSQIEMPVEAGSVSVAHDSKLADNKTLNIRLPWAPFPNGGIKQPHLHYDGGTYLLNDEQWAAFSNKVKEDFSKKLSKASTIKFDQLMKLSNLMEEIR